MAMVSTLDIYSRIILCDARAGGCGMRPLDLQCLFGQGFRGTRQGI